MAHAKNRCFVDVYLPQKCCAAALKLVDGIIQLA
jgi:hypothetical protein